MYPADMISELKAMSLGNHSVSLVAVTTALILYVATYCTISGNIPCSRVQGTICPVASLFNLLLAMCSLQMPLTMLPIVVT